MTEQQLAGGSLIGPEESRRIMGELQMNWRGINALFAPLEDLQSAPVAMARIPCDVA